MSKTFISNPHKIHSRYNHPQVTNDRIWIQKGWIISTNLNLTPSLLNSKPCVFFQYGTLLQCPGLFLATISIWESRVIHVQYKTEQSASFLELHLIFPAYQLPRLRPPYSSLLHQKGLNLFLTRMLGSLRLPCKSWNLGFNCHWFICSSSCMMTINQQ